MSYELRLALFVLSYFVCGLVTWLLTKRLFAVLGDPIGPAECVACFVFAPCAAFATFMLWMVSRRIE